MPKPTMGAGATDGYSDCLPTANFRSVSRRPDGSRVNVSNTTVATLLAEEDNQLFPSSLRSNSQFNITRVRCRSGPASDKTRVA